MNPKLSTNELFHFTQFDRLLNIIKEGFYPRYNLEHTFLSEMFERPAAIETIPMVSFCDIPLNMVQEHSSKYGRCAIGLDKKWGGKYGLNPVIYVHKNSSIGDAISALANSLSSLPSSIIKEGGYMKILMLLSTVAKGFGQLSYYVKQYERTEDEQYYIGNKIYTFNKGRFYDEREWRFVPPNFLIEDFWLVNADILANEIELNKAHEKLKKHSLKFDLDDIKYIVCETLEENEKLLTAIAERFGFDNEIILKKVTFKIIGDT